MAAMPASDTNTWLEQVGNSLHYGPNSTDDQVRYLEQLRRERHAVLIQLGEQLRTVDRMLAALASGAVSDPVRTEELIAQGRELRNHLFNILANAEPDQAWYWTEEWQAGEREADADIAAGRVTRHESDEDFLVALDARRASHADP